MVAVGDHAPINTERHCWWRIPLLISYQTRSYYLMLVHL